MAEVEGKRRRRSSVSPVVVRSMNSPKPGWSEERAVDMVRQGYSPDRIAELSGFAAAYLRAQLSVKVPVSTGVAD